MNREDLMIVLNSFEEHYKEQIQRGSHMHALLDFENEAGWQEDIEDKIQFKGVYGLAPLKREFWQIAKSPLEREHFATGYTKLESGLIVPDNIARMAGTGRRLFRPQAEIVETFGIM
jgi:hypothetical protein